MKHNLILGWVCVSFLIVFTASSYITGKPTIIPSTILFVAALYFFGRYGDQQDNENRFPYL